MDGITIQDNRKRGWFWADNVIIDVYLARLGETAFAVYMTLCRHANNETHRALLSLPRLAAKVGKSRRTAARAVVALSEAGLITVISGKRDDGLNEANVYQINDVGSLPEVSKMALRSATHDTTVVSPVALSQDSLIKTHSLNIIAEENPTDFPRAPEPKPEPIPEPPPLPKLPQGYQWITSTISDETLTHILKGERGKPLCGATIKHRTAEPLKLATKTPCPACLEAVQKPKQTAPSAEIKDALAKLCFGTAEGLLPLSWKRLVRAWNQLGCPDLPAVQRLETAWYKHDWRGQKRQRPTPEQLVQVRDAILAGTATRQPDYNKKFFTPMTPEQEEELRRASLAQVHLLPWNKKTEGES